MCYQELQCQSLACIVLTCCLQKRENDQEISACIQPEEWSSHSEMVSSVGCWMSHNDYKGYPIKMILHQHAEGALLMVADPFPNNDPSEFTVKIVFRSREKSHQPVCRWPAIGQRLLRLANAGSFHGYFLKLRNSQIQWNLSIKMCTYSAKGPWNKSSNFIFPTKSVIPKSLKVSHWLSKCI